MTINAKHQIVIIGGGTAGITVAARMRRKGFSDVAVIEPSSTHHYQPLWTLVGAGQATAASTERAEASVMPKGVTWIKNAANTFDPDSNTVYWGTGNASPWFGDQRPGDNLYTSSTLALDGDTGKIKGYFQYHQNESWDWDEMNAPMLVAAPSRWLVKLQFKRHTTRPAAPTAIDAATVSKAAWGGSG